MAVEKLPPDYENKTRDKLIEAKSTLFQLVLFNFVFSPMVRDLMDELDAEFSGNRGRKAYPRVLLLIVVMYCFSKKINKYGDMVEKCEESDFLKIILNGRQPSRNTFANFLNNSNHEMIHRVFIATLVRLNDINAFSITKVFIDGTDVLVRASRNYYIKQEDLKAMYQLNKWKLLHNGSKKSIKKSLKGLDIKLEEYEDNEEMVKLINLAKRRIKIHKHKVFAKRKRYEKEFEKRGDVKLSIIFPESVMLKTKRGMFDFAYNLQEVMTSNYIIFVGVMLSHPNDQKAIPPVYKQMKKTLDIYLEMQSKYGQRNNPDKHIKAFANIIIVADAGYFTIVNLYFLFKHRINAVIKPSTESREDNNKLREKSGNPTNEKKSIRKYLTRVLGGYECDKGCFFKYKKSIAIKHRKPQKDDNLPEVCRKERQIYERKPCKDCPYDSECPKVIEDRKPFILRWMTDRFLDKRRNIHYGNRFSISEGINGNNKLDGFLKFVATTPNAVDNECDLRNAGSNLIREINLKEVGY